MKQNLAAFLCLCCGLSAWADLRYVEVSSVGAASKVRVEKIEDLQFLIQHHGIEIGYLLKGQNNPTDIELVVVGDGTQFFFNMNGYRSIDSCLAGSAGGFLNGADFQEAVGLELAKASNPDSALYYFYRRNKFKSIADCKDAFQKGFSFLNGTGTSNLYGQRQNAAGTESTAYYKAREAQLADYKEYQEFSPGLEKGFKTKADILDARKKGFGNARGQEYYTAMERGFSQYTDYKAATDLGLESQASYTTDWLFLRPEHCIYSHFPEQQRDQLLATPLSADEFSQQADFRPKFFQVATEVAPLPVKTNAVDGSLELSYQEQDGYQLDFTLQNLDTGRAVSNAVMVQRTGEHKVRAAFSFPAAGLYEVTVFYHKNGSRQGTSCGQFLVQANRAGTVQYPALSPADGVQVLAPLTMPLASGREVLFQVAAPQKKFVALIYGRTYIQLERDGKGVFSAKVSVPRNVTEVSLGVANSERGSYQVVATYKVQ